MKMNCITFLLIVFFFIASVCNCQPYLLVDGMYEDNSLIKIWYTALGLMDDYERGEIAGFEIAFDCDGRYYDSNRGKNWWEYYFSFCKVGSFQNSLVVRMPRHQRSTTRFRTVCTMSPERGHFLLNRYMKLNHRLCDKISDIKSELWPEDAPVVGVYYQKPIMPDVQHAWSPIELCERVHEEIEKMGISSAICLFTEEDGFAEVFASRFSEQYFSIHYFNDGSEESPADRGERELLSLLLLSSCNVVIAPGSYQGHAAKMLNPSLYLIELDTIPYART